MPCVSLTSSHNRDTDTNSVSCPIQELSLTTPCSAGPMKDVLKGQGGADVSFRPLQEGGVSCGTPHHRASPYENIESRRSHLYVAPEARDLHICTAGGCLGRPAWPCMHHLSYGLQCIINGCCKLSELQGPALRLALKQLRVVAHLQMIVTAEQEGGA